VLLASALAAAGCGIGAGEASEGTATLTITRDYGSESLHEATVSDPAESETVIRFLDREAEITTRHGDNFVQSIDGLAGRLGDGSRFDWFFYVNGYWSPIGAGEAEVHAGDRIWWDYREWSAAYTVPAVVGSFPEPFLNGYGGERFDVVVECEIEPADACERVEGVLRDEGVELRSAAATQAADADVLRVLVGPFGRLADDPAAKLLAAGPTTSGIFASIEIDRHGGYALFPAGVDGELRAGEQDRAGLIAATRVGDEQPTWLVTGVDRSGAEAAAEIFDAEHLRDRFAVAVIDGEVVPLPIEAGS